MLDSAHIRVMTDAARKAGRGLIRDYGELTKLQVSPKGTFDFVTSADLKAEKIILEILQKARPGYSVLSEEAGEITGQSTEYRWIVDPLDGTSNFMHGLPHFCISIALEKKTAGKGEIIAAVIFAPILDELYVAEKGQGAFVNNARMQVSGRKNLNSAMLSSYIMRNELVRRTHALNHFNAAGANLRIFGSAALELAYLAAGKVDGFWHEGLKCWDMAAGALMVREARGMVTEIDGKPFGVGNCSILAANSNIHPLVSKVLNEESE